MKVAIVYDRVNKWGGAERVLLSLHKIFPKAPLYTSVYDKKNASWAKVFRVKTSFLQHIPFVKSHHELFPFLMPFAFASFSFDKYDLVISVTSEYAKGIRTRGKTKHICICLTPTRYLWSGYTEYFANKTLRFLSLPLVMILRLYDKIIAKKPDVMVAISQEVQRRIKKYYKRESEVIYPPVIVSLKSKLNKLFASDYFLVVSRLSKFTQYKRVDISVKAATKLSASLVVVGAGDSSSLRNIAGPTVQFTGKVNDSELAQFYLHSRALIFSGKEDFGLVMAEAQGYGVPIIAYKAGGALEIVEDGKTGTFFDRQNPDSLVKVLKKFDRRQYNRKAIIASADRFSQKAFEKALKRIIKQNI